MNKQLEEGVRCCLPVKLSMSMTQHSIGHVMFPASMVLAAIFEGKLFCLELL